MTCWDWLALAVAAATPGPGAYRTATALLRTAGSRGRVYLGAAGMGKFADVLLDDVPIAWVNVRVIADQRTIVSMAFPREEVLVGLDWLDKHPVPRWRCKAPGCNSTTTTLINYDPLWRDGDIVCASCAAHVRNFDAG